MVALKELPDKTKDIIQPIFPLRRWFNSNKLDNTIQKIEESYSGRSWVADIDSYKRPEADKRKEVHEQIERLLDPADGYRGWVDFIGDTENAVPCLQYSDPRQFQKQFDAMAAIGRGCVLRITSPNSWRALPALLSEFSRNPEVRKLIILDFDYLVPSDLTKRVSITKTFVDQILKYMGPVPTVLSSTSFPKSFDDGKTERIIVERQFFDEMRKICPDAMLIYGDHGSTRELKSGGNGEPIPPRIDYPLRDRWVSIKEKGGSYQAVAKELKDTKGVWDDDLRIWGTQMIETTAKGDDFGISNPKLCTSVRINIHLHRQAYFDAEVGQIYETEDDWVD